MIAGLIINSQIVSYQVMGRGFLLRAAPPLLGFSSRALRACVSQPQSRTRTRSYRAREHMPNADHSAQRPSIALAPKCYRTTFERKYDLTAAGVLGGINLEKEKGRERAGLCLEILTVWSMNQNSAGLDKIWPATRTRTGQVRPR